MIKLIGTIMVVSMIIMMPLFSGCATVEAVWESGKEIGSKILNDETKDKLEPYVDGVENVYGVIKDDGKK